MWFSHKEKRMLGNLEITLLNFVFCSSVTMNFCFCWEEPFMSELWQKLRHNTQTADRVTPSQWEEGCRPGTSFLISGHVSDEWLEPEQSILGVLLGVFVWWGISCSFPVIAFQSSWISKLPQNASPWMQLLVRGEHHKELRNKKNSKLIVLFSVFIILLKETAWIFCFCFFFLNFLLAQIFVFYCSWDWAAAAAVFGFDKLKLNRSLSGFLQIIGQPQ